MVMMSLDVVFEEVVTYRVIEELVSLSWRANEGHRAAPDSCLRRSTGTPRCNGTSCRTPCTCCASVGPKHVPIPHSPFV